MLTRIKRWFMNLFASEVRVMRPGTESIDTPLNRKQRRTKAALERKNKCHGR